MEKCEGCGGEIRHCSLCGRREFHLTFEGRSYSSCAFCDTMTRWPRVCADVALSRAIVAATHPSRATRAA